MPDAALGREPLVGDPHVGAEVLDLVIFDDRLGKTDDLKDHDVPAVGEDKGLLLAQGGVVFLVEFEAVLVDKLVFRFAAVECLQDRFP